MRILRSFELVLLGLLCFVVGSHAQNFAAGCALPESLKLIKLIHPIDSGPKACSKSGKSTEPDKVAESKVKNNFCATGDPSTGQPVDIEYDTLIELQSAIDDEHFHLGDRFHPARPTHKFDTGKGKLGEKDLVRLTAWVLRAKNSNSTSGGENVNCNKNGNDNNDIHIVLAKFVNHADIDEDECNSVTAEAIPHFRPATWTRDNLMENRDHPFRFTGQLFLDSDHTPCRSNGTGGSPDRASVWEVHPVYNIEICKFKSKTKCSGDSAWVSFDDWIGGDK